MKLHGTPLSHFTRKIRILAAELEIPLELVRERTVMSTSVEAYANNPLMRVPTLVDGDVTLIESDHIARYLVAKHDPSDRLGVRSERVEDLNRLAVLNGVMANEVTPILSKRGGLDITGIVYFDKLLAAIDSGLAWLDARIDPDAPGFDYRDLTLICAWQHLAHYGLRPLDPYRRLAARVARFADRPSVASTTPERSLADAAAAGWTPG
ncbi:MAG: glutathione S-transferase family protein [Myxococcales bacterium]|nr:glutathione S-transferase family protein [Myxococcales bacterium]